MSNKNVAPVPITDMKGVLPVARQCICDLLERRTGSTDITLDVYREWSGGWRVSAVVRGPVQGTMDFVLLHTPQGGVLAMPSHMPERWRTRYGVAASDGSVWTVDNQGQIVPFNQ